MPHDDSEVDVKTISLSTYKMKTDLKIIPKLTIDDLRIVHGDHLE